MRTVAVIGKNFGDEGKGLVCASLSKNMEKTLIVKHNGGGPKVLSERTFAHNLKTSATAKPATMA